MNSLVIRARQTMSALALSSSAGLALLACGAQGSPPRIALVNGVAPAPTFVMTYEPHEATPARPVKSASSTPGATSQALPAAPSRHPGWIPLRFSVEYVVEWATFLNAVHQRIHPLVSERYLDKLDHAPESDARNDPSLSVLLELVFAPDGSLANVSVVRSSGVDTFDEEIIEAIRGATPFPKPGPRLRSPDGNAYVDWSFHRDETSACSTIHSRPVVYGVLDAGFSSGS